MADTAARNLTNVERLFSKSIISGALGAVMNSFVSRHDLTPSTPAKPVESKLVGTRNLTLHSTTTLFSLVTCKHPQLHARPCTNELPCLSQSVPLHDTFRVMIVTPEKFTSWPCMAKYNVSFMCGKRIGTGVISSSRHVNGSNGKSVVTRGSPSDRLVETACGSTTTKTSPTATDDLPCCKIYRLSLLVVRIMAKHERGLGDHRHQTPQIGPTRQHHRR